MIADPTKPTLENVKLFTDIPNMEDWDEVDFIEERQLLYTERSHIYLQIELAKANLGENVSAWSQGDREWLYRAHAAKKHIKNRMIAVRAEHRRRYPESADSGGTMATLQRIHYLLNRHGLWAADDTYRFPDGVVVERGKACPNFGGMA